MTNLVSYKQNKDDLAWIRINNICVSYKKYISDKTYIFYNSLSVDS